MKHNISITLEEEVLLGMKQAIRLSKDFRNQSHFVELAISEKLGAKDEKQDNKN